LHEAAHALVGRFYGLPVKLATVVANEFFHGMVLAPVIRMPVQRPLRDAEALCGQVVQHMDELADRKLLCGARAIAQHVFRDEKFERRVYELRHELPIFKVGHFLFAFADGLDAVLARKEIEAERALRCRKPELIDA